MRELKRIVIGSNFSGNLNALKAENKTVLWERSQEEIEGGYRLVNNHYQFVDYRNMALVPIVNDIVHGNVNGRIGAELLYETFKNDRGATDNKAQIEWWLRTITLGQVTTKPGGVCWYSPEYRIMLINEARERWQANYDGERDRMYIIGDCMEQQGVEYRYLPKAAPDETTILLVCLPNPKSVVDAFKKQKGEVVDKPTIEAQVQEVANRVVEESVLPVTQETEKPKEIVPTTARRNIKRKKKEEVDITKLEESSVEDE